MNKYTILTGWLSLLLFVSGFAQNPAWTTFTTNDGLANFHVLAIAEDGNGALWFGTIDGVSRYDGQSWTTFTRADGLADNQVTAIIEDSNGALWFGTEGGVSRYDGQNWTTFTEANGLAGNRVFAIAQDRNGVLWFGTNNGVSRYNGQSWTTFTTADGLADNDVNAIFEDSKGALWFGTSYGVSRYDGQSWTTFTRADGLSYNNVTAIIEDSNGAIWFGTTKGVSRYNGQSWTSFTMPDVDWENSNVVISMAEDGNGALWFGAYSGVSRYDGQSWTRFTVVNGLYNIFVHAIIEDSNGALWFGMMGGARRYDGQSWTTFTEADGLADNDVNAIFKDSNGGLWFGTDNGMSRYDGRSWTTFTTADGLASNLVLAIVEDRTSAIWFGTGGGGVSRYDGQNWTTFTKADGLVSNSVRAIVEDSNDALWFGTNDGVSRYNEQSWTTFTIDNGLTHNDVNAIFKDSNGRLWFGTDDGVSRYDGQSWTTFTESDGLADNNVLAIAEDGNGALWFGTFGSVSRYDGQSWTTFIQAPFLFDPLTITKDSNGALWFGTHASVSRYDGQSLTTIIEDHDLAGSMVHAIAEDGEGALWIGTSGGVSRLSDIVSPRVSFLITPGALTGNISPLFNYVGNDNLAPASKLFFAWELEGEGGLAASGDWSLATSVTLPPLQDGEYTFTVKAKDFFNNVTGKPPRYSFRVDATQPTVIFNSHKSKDQIADSAAIIGNAFDSSPIQDFIRYDLHYGFGRDTSQVVWQSEHLSRLRPTEEIFNDTLAVWHTDELPNGPYWLRLSAIDSLGHTSTVYLDVEVVESAVDVNREKGVKQTTADIDIFLPPNAISEDARLIVRTCQMDEITLFDSTGVTFANYCFAVEFDELVSSSFIQEFNKPATLSLSYKDSIPAGIDESKLALYYSEDGMSNWQRLGGLVNQTEKKITAVFKKPGYFGLYKDLSEGTETGLFDLDIQPRVFSPNSSGLRSSVDISYTLGKASNVTCKIYNAAGRLIAILGENEPRNRGVNVEQWNGLDLRQQTCPSGLYVVTVQADGKTKIKTVAVMATK